MSFQSVSCQLRYAASKSPRTSPAPRGCGCGGAVLFEAGIELRGHRLVRGGPLGIAAAENGVRQLVKRVLSRLVHPMVELDRVVRW